MTNNQLTTFYLIRHGQSEINANYMTWESIPKEKTDADLTELGVKQAKQVAERLKDIAFNAIFSSDLLRARRTAEIINQERKLELVTSKALRERSKGSLSHKTEKKLREEFKDLFDAYDKLPDSEKFTWKLVPDWESAEEVVTRLLTYLREIAVAYPGKNILVISHSNTLRTLLVHLGYATFKELPVGTFSNTGYIVLQTDGSDFFIKETHGVNKKEI